MPKNKFILKKRKKQFTTLVMPPPIFVTDTKIIYGYNVVAPFIINTIRL